MASAKKPVKKVAAKKAPVKAKATTKITHKVAKRRAEVQSFRLARPAQPFLSFEFTVQTLYWALLCAIVLALGVWVMTINIQVQNIYDQVDETNRTLDSIEAQ